MNGRRGFTLIELAIVVAVIAAVAAAAGSTFYAAKRNASTSSTAFDLTVRLQGMKTRALNEQTDYVVVLVNPQDGTGSSCGVLSSTQCLRWFVLKSPDATWKLSDFKPGDPAQHVSALTERESLPVGIAFDLGQAGSTAPAPFDSITLFDANVKGSCDGFDCVGVRFGADGEVSPVYSGTSTPVLAGMAFALKSDAQLGGQGRAMLVSFPTGIVKTGAY